MITQHRSQEIAVEVDSTLPPSLQNQQKTFSPTSYHNSKITAERILGCLLLVIAAPAIGLIVALVRITSKGNGIYKQIRVGKNGKEFPIYKIRTMRADAEACGNAQWSSPGDSRITPVGRVLRFLHLDELPQLVNVALGHMSLVGPRPERPEFVTKLEITVPDYMDRLAVLPGVTGLAQINLPADDSLESVRQKVILDRQYIQSATLSLDIRIFCCTLLRMTGLRHGVAPWLFGVECDPHNISMAKNPCPDTVELAGALDDTAINIPALIRNSPIEDATANKTVAKSNTLREQSQTCTLETEQTNNTDETSSSPPRRPR